MMNGYHANYEDQLFMVIKEIPAECFCKLSNTVQNFCTSLSLKSAESSFKQGWEEAMSGETMPIDKLWVGIEDDG